MWTTLLSVVVGGFLATVGGIVAQTWQRRHDRRSLAYAFAGEINAIVASIEKRKYVAHVEQTIQNMKQTGTPWTYTISITKPYFHIYEANAAKIGLLPPPLTKRISGFYTMIFSLMEDVMPENNQRPMTTAESLVLLSGILELGKQTLADGKSLVVDLEKM